MWSDWHAGGQKRNGWDEGKEKTVLHLGKGSWAVDQGWGMKRSSNASSIPTDNATDIENGFCVARYVYVNVPGVLLNLSSFNNKF